MSHIMPFVVFVSLFFFLYFSINFYLYKSVVIGFDVPIEKRKIYRLIFILLALSYPASIFLEKISENIFVKIFIFSSGVWFGVLLISVTVFFISHIFLLIFKFLFKLEKAKYYCNRIALILSFVLCLYALYSGLRIPYVNKIEIPCNNLGRENFKILQISDTHLGNLRGMGLLNEIVNEARDLKPDLIVITGDFIDENLKILSRVSPSLNQLKNVAPVIAIPGNHEFYAGIEGVEKFFKNENINFIRDKKINFNNELDIIGCDDSKGFEGSKKDNLLIDQLFKECKNDKPILFLKHKPTEFDELASKYSFIQLSGHTHNGQIFPGHVFVWMIFKYYTGLHKYKNSYIYISNGAGVWGAPMRLFSRPEITLVELKRL
jgi:uncharacterized protein